MTLQRIFDKVVNHLRKQGKRCADDKGKCLYRLETGNRKKVLKCAAGCLIPKADYRPIFENQAVTVHMDNEVSAYFRDKFATKDDYYPTIRLIRDLQSAHDSNWSWEGEGQLEARFKQIANDFNLTYTAPTV